MRPALTFRALVPTKEPGFLPFFGNFVIQQGGILSEAFFITSEDYL